MSLPLSLTLEPSSSYTDFTTSGDRAIEDFSGVGAIRGYELSPWMATVSVAEVLLSEGTQVTVPLSVSGGFGYGTTVYTAMTYWYLRHVTNL